MGQVFTWSVTVVVLSALVLLQAVARRARQGRLGGGMPLLFPGSALVVLLAAAASTLPWQHVPWSRGAALWPGILLGGASVLLVTWLGHAGGTAEDEQPDRAWNAVIEAATPALGIGVLLLALPMTPPHPPHILDALGGFGIGALVAGLLSGIGPVLTGLRGAVIGSAERSTLLAIALACSTYLAALHHTPTLVREWEPLPALLTAATAVLLAVRATLAGGRRPWLMAVGIVWAPLLILAAVIAYRLHGTPALLPAVAVGVVVTALIAWREALDQETPESATSAFRALPRSGGSGLLGAFLILGAAALAFHDLHGYGISLFALTAALVWIALPDPRAVGGLAGASLVPGGVALALSIVLYRVFQQKVVVQESFRPEEIYYYCSLIAGALLPLGLAGLAVDRPVLSDGPATIRPAASALLRVGLVGLGAALAPLVVWLLVGERAQSAFVMGLAIAAALTMRPLRAGDPVIEPIMARLLTLCSAVTAIQLTALVEPLGDLTRRQRIEILAALAGVVLLILALAVFLERRRSQIPSGGAPYPTQSEVPGG